MPIALPVLKLGNGDKRKSEHETQVNHSLDVPCPDIPATSLPLTPAVGQIHAMREWRARLQASGRRRAGRGESLHW